MRHTIPSPVIQPGDRIFALLPLRFQEEPATVLSLRRDGSIAVVLDALPSQPLVCCDWRRQPASPAGGGTLP